MYLLTAIGGINTGEMMIQLIVYLTVLTIPLVIIISVFVFRKRNSRLKRVEEKLDKLISDKEKS